MLYLSNIKCTVMFIKATKTRKIKVKIVILIMTTLLF